MDIERTGAVVDIAGRAGALPTALGVDPDEPVALMRLDDLIKLHRYAEWGRATLRRGRN